MEAKDFSDLWELEENLWWFRGMRGITGALLDAELSDRIPRTILDVGCGTGANLKFLERYANGRDVVGVDIAREALEFCTRSGATQLAQASATALPFPSGYFDLVTSFDVIVQIPGEAADARALVEMNRVLKPGGTAFIRAAAYEWMRAGHDATMNTQRRYTLRELQAKCRDAGFEIVRTTYANAALLPAAILKRLVLERLGLASTGSDVRRFPAAIAWLDPVFRTALSFESSILRRRRTVFPFGLSAVCVARKPL